MEPMDFSNLSLTALYYPERLCFHTKLNLNGNALKNVQPLRALLNCQELDISDNNMREDDVRNAVNQLKQLTL